MQTLRYVTWQDGDMWLGYLEDYPEYWTQGRSEDDLKDHLLDILYELRSGNL